MCDDPTGGADIHMGLFDRGQDSQLLNGGK